jgi:hypothetical protein
MLNQAFTADNFENIYDIENRKSSITEYLGTEYKDILLTSTLFRCVFYNNLQGNIL